MFTRSRKSRGLSAGKENARGTDMKPMKPQKRATEQDSPSPSVDVNHNETFPSFKSSWKEPLTDSGSMPKISKYDSSAVHANSRGHSSNPGCNNIKHEQGKEEIKINDNRSDSEEDENTYIKIRMKNMKENEEFLASIGIHKAREQLRESVTSKKNTPSQRGLKIKRHPVEPLPLRKSLRLSRVDPDGIPLPAPVPEPVAVDLIERLPEGPLSMKSCLYSATEDESYDQFCNFMIKASKCVKNSKSSNLSDNKVSDFSKMSLKEECVAKVVPGRVFSLDWHPSSDNLIVAAGDKYGHIGVWSVLGSGKDGNAIVTAFKPHIKPVSQLMFSPLNPQKLFSSSYDSTLRGMDIEKNVFDELFSVPEEDDDLFRDFCFIDSNVMTVARYSGALSIVDMRTPSTSAEQSYTICKKSLHTVHRNPISSHHVITAGGDATVCLWDLRSMGGKSPKSLVTLRNHTKTVSSAYFSPDGQQILTCSVDNFIFVFSCQSTSTVKLSKTIRHNNCTGRWLTKFRPSWHPTRKGVFVTGSMAQPRRIEIFDSSTGSRIADLDSDYLNSVCSLNKFHPSRPTTLVGANSSGRLQVFM